MTPHAFFIALCAITVISFAFAQAAASNTADPAFVQRSRASYVTSALAGIVAIAWHNYTAPDPAITGVLAVFMLIVLGLLVLTALYYIARSFGYVGYSDTPTSWRNR